MPQRTASRMYSELPAGRSVEPRPSRSATVLPAGEAGTGEAGARPDGPAGDDGRSLVSFPAVRRISRITEARVWPSMYCIA